MVDALVLAAGVAERVLRKECSCLNRKRDDVARGVHDLKVGCVDMLSCEDSDRLTGLFSALENCIQREEIAFSSLMASTESVLLRGRDAASALKEQDRVWRAAWAAREQEWKAAAAAIQAVRGRADDEGAGPRAGVDVSIQCGDSCVGNGASRAGVDVSSQCGDLVWDGMGPDTGVDCHTQCWFPAGFASRCFGGGRAPRGAEWELRATAEGSFGGRARALGRARCTRATA